MNEMLFLRMKVKSDTSTAQAVAAMTGLHVNTISKIINPCYTVIDPRKLEVVNRLARHYGYRTVISVSFVPLKLNGNE